MNLDNPNIYNAISVIVILLSVSSVSYIMFNTYGKK